MNEWSYFSLGNLATFRKGVNYTSSDYGDQDSGRPFITIKCFVKGGGYERNGLKHIKGEFKKEDRLLEGDVLFSVTDLTRAGDIVGSPLQVPCFGDNSYAVASMDCMKIEPILGVCDKDFLYQRMMLPDIRRQMVAYSAGSTVLHLDTKQVPRIAACFPISVEVQQKIARILQTIDQAIEKTESLIEKYQKIKAGLMHDLFTRGIGPDGQLRPPREQAPELYQETPIGWVPKDWASTCLNDIVNPARPVVYGILMPGYGYEGGVPVVKVKDIRDRRIDVGSLLLTSPKIDQEYKRSRLESGDILITIRGSVGRICIVPKELEGANITQDSARIDIFIGSTIFYSYFLESEIARRHFDINTLGVAVQGINLSEVRKVPIVIPSEGEQERIARILDTMVLRIEAEKRQLNKLKKQKSGLMHDLLSGEVVVQVDPKAEPVAAHA